MPEQMSIISLRRPSNNVQMGASIIVDTLSKPRLPSHWPGLHETQASSRQKRWGEPPDEDFANDYRADLRRACYGHRNRDSGVRSRARGRTWKVRHAPGRSQSCGCRGLGRSALKARAVIQITPRMRILVAVDPTDFRRGIDGLARQCRQALQRDPFSGALFVFRNRSAKAIKILAYDGQGFWLCQKRLSHGSVWLLAGGHGTHKRTSGPRAAGAAERRQPGRGRRRRHRGGG